MANELSKRDENSVTTLLGVTDDGNEEVRRLLVDPTTGRLKVSAVISTDFDDLNDVVITDGAAGDTLYYNGTNWVNLGIGSAGEVLTVNSGATAPEWSSAGAGGASSLNDLSDVAISTPAAGHVLIYNNTASEFQNSLLTGGDGIALTNGDASITLAVDLETSGGLQFTSGELGVDEANVDHDSLQNFVANEHVDHSSVSISAGNGLSGGGDITTTRTLNVDINGATDLASPAVEDELLLADVSNTNAIRKSDTGTVLDLYNDRTATLTNKTINTASNTITVVEADISDLQSYLLNVVEDTTPQLGGDFDAQNNQITDVGNLTVNQDADASGITIAGFDDESTNTLKMSINALGRGEIDTTSQFDYKVNNTSVSQLTSSAWIARDDIKLGVGDSTDHWFLYDSANTQFEFENTTGLIFTVDDGTTDVDMNNNDLQSIQTATFNGEVDNGNSGTFDTIDWTAGNKQKSTLTGNVTFSFTAPPGPTNLLLKLIQDGTGSRTVTWPASVKWAGGTAPTLTTTAGAEDIITFYYDGTSYYGTASLDFS